jgi:hypothetical protein
MPVQIGAGEWLSAANCVLMCLQPRCWSTGIVHALRPYKSAMLVQIPRSARAKGAREVDLCLDGFIAQGYRKQKDKDKNKHASRRIPTYSAAALFSSDSHGTFLSTSMKKMTI